LHLISLEISQAQSLTWREEAGGREEVVAAAVPGAAWPAAGAVECHHRLFSHLALMMASGNLMKRWQCLFAKNL
jgi:hypothetical protein